ncbi:flagellar assembly protein FliH [Pelomicrobium sp. G1]|uniref:flagellar assembly protein FliH n=1 Tax=unclassified Pelomicrobium TaxID=2815318 RepID=UPI0021DC0095|nr:MAG: flagellar assembly protein FliH [Burkholderiales bacterium]
MSSVIPKERLSAYQRWELGSFDPAPPEAPVTKLPTAEELEQWHQSARDEGYAAGYAEGLAQARLETERLKAIGEAWSSALASLEEEVSQALVQLALAIAAHVLREALAVRPELVIAVVKEAMAAVPHSGAHPRLVLHPDDALLVRRLLAHELEQGGWKLVEDPVLERGGCRVESAATTVDATLAGRWERITAALQDEQAWTP